MPRLRKPLSLRRSLQGHSACGWSPQPLHRPWQTPVRSLCRYRGLHRSRSLFYPLGEFGKIKHGCTSFNRISRLHNVFIKVINTFIIEKDNLCRSDKSPSPSKPPLPRSINRAGPGEGGGTQRFPSPSGGGKRWGGVESDILFSYGPINNNKTATPIP